MFPTGITAATPTYRSIDRIAGLDEAKVRQVLPSPEHSAVSQPRVITAGLDSEDALHRDRISGLSWTCRATFQGFVEDSAARIRRQEETLQGSDAMLVRRRAAKGSRAAFSRSANFHRRRFKGRLFVSSKGLRHADSVCWAAVVVASPLRRSGSRSPTRATAVSEVVSQDG